MFELNVLGVFKRNTGKIQGIRVADSYGNIYDTTIGSLFEDIFPLYEQNGIPSEQIHVEGLHIPKDFYGHFTVKKGIPCLGSLSRELKVRSSGAVKIDYPDKFDRYYIKVQ